MCVCVCSTHACILIRNREDGVGKGGGVKECIIQDLVMYAQIE